MQSITQIVLNPGKELALQRNHPWVFSGAIKKINGPATTGSLVEVFSNKQEFMGTGIYQDGTIAVRIMAFAPERPQALDRAFWKSKLENAYNLRVTLGLANNPQTNAYRLVHGEGDNMPGLIIDYYAGHIVIQVHSTGLYSYLEPITLALKDIYGDKLQNIYDKSRDTLPSKYFDNTNPEGVISQNPSPILVKENGNKFYVDIEKGQKTGFYLDQRDNRQLLSLYSKGKDVLNTFSYSGGFSVYALKAGAKSVHSIDSSAKAIELTKNNVALNLGEDSPHEAICQDTLEYLHYGEKTYDVIILDPPAFAKHTHARHNAIQGYKRLNLEALKKIRKGGILFTFSCSQVVDKALFRSTVMAAAIQSGRRVRILHQLSQPCDHPVNIFHPEGEYLKGLVLFVE